MANAQATKMPNQPNHEALRVEGLCKVYGDKQVLKDLNFSVNQGEFLAILGPSGCGKTTLLKILIGIEDATSGAIYKADQDITALPSKDRCMGIVFQNYALFENMTVLRNVEYAMKFHGIGKEEATSRAKEMLAHVNLSEHLDKLPKELSGGQQQRVAIARTLVLKPSIILFDEPMSALDAATRIELRAVIKNLQAEFGTTMIYITHDQEESFAMADRIMVMNNAELIQIDTPENILKSPAHEYVKSFVIDNLKAKVDSISQYVGLVD